jgi:hypothetical protein
MSAFESTGVRIVSGMNLVLLLSAAALWIWVVRAPAPVVPGRNREDVSLTVIGIAEAIRKAFGSHCIRRVVVEEIPGGVHLVVVEFMSGRSLEQVPIRSQSDWHAAEARMTWLYDLSYLTKGGTL